MTGITPPQPSAAAVGVPAQCTPEIRKPSAVNDETTQIGDRKAAGNAQSSDTRQAPEQTDDHAARGAGVRDARCGMQGAGCEVRGTRSEERHEARHEARHDVGENARQNTPAASAEIANLKKRPPEPNLKPPRPAPECQIIKPERMTTIADR